VAVCLLQAVYKFLQHTEAPIALGLDREKPATTVMRVSTKRALSLKVNLESSEFAVHSSINNKQGDRLQHIMKVAQHT